LPDRRDTPAYSQPLMSGNGCGVQGVTGVYGVHVNRQTGSGCKSHAGQLDCISD
jgi:hypothetical protein